MFNDPTILRQTVAAALKVDPASLAPYWDNEILRCQESAYKDIRGALLTRGFLAPQVDAWDRGMEFERDLTLFWALARGYGGVPQDMTQLETLDRRKELLTVHVEIAGGTTQVPTASPGRISAGMIENLDADGNCDRWTRHTRL